MSKKRPPCSDADLWAQFVKQNAITPKEKTKAKKNDPSVMVTSPMEQPSTQPPPTKVVSPAPQNIQKKSSIAGALDKHVSSQLKRGKHSLEATLDLHHMTQPEAHRALMHFLQNAQKRRYKLVLVITGKGRNLHRNNPSMLQEGVLRQKLRGWIATSPYAESVVSISVAQRRDGGEGAFYIHLRTPKPF